MTTRETINGKEITVRWEKHGLEDDAGDGHTYFFEASGYDGDGNIWTAKWVESDGEVEITDAEIEN